MVSGQSESNKKLTQKNQGSQWNQQPETSSSDLDYVLLQIQEKPSTPTGVVSEDLEGYSSSLPSQEDVSEFFINDKIWEDDKTDISIVQKTPPLKREVVDELKALFGEEDETPNTKPEELIGLFGEEDETPNTKAEDLIVGLFGEEDEIPSTKPEELIGLFGEEDETSNTKAEDLIVGLFDEEDETSNTKAEDLIVGLFDEEDEIANTKQEDLIVGLFDEEDEIANTKQEDLIVGLFDEETPPPTDAQLSDIFGQNRHDREQEEDWVFGEGILIQETEGSIVLNNPHENHATVIERPLVPCLALYSSLEEIEKEITQPKKYSREVDYEALERLITSKLTTNTGVRAEVVARERAKGTRVGQPASLAKENEELILSPVHIDDSDDWQESGTVLFNFESHVGEVVSEDLKGYSSALPSQEDVNALFTDSNERKTADRVSKKTKVEDPYKDLAALAQQTNISIQGANLTPATIGSQQATQTAPKLGKSSEQTMRVPIKQLDNLSNLIGELVIKRNGLEQDQERMQQFVDNLLNQVQMLGNLGTQMQELYEGTLLDGALQASSRRISASQNTQNQSMTDDQRIANTAGQLGQSDSTPRAATPPSIDGSSSFNNHGFNPLELDRFTSFHLIAQEMMEVVVRVRESASDIQFLVGSSEQVTRSLRQVTTQLQEGMTKSRMVTFGPIAERFSRAVKNICLRLNKQAKLQVDGKDVLVDKMILEHLYDPMTHLVNNAMTHGIETPEERQRKGKPPEGKLTIRAFLQGNQTVIVVEDDGAGINPEVIKAKAIEKGLLTLEETKNIKRQDLYDLLFHPGFTTKDKADDFAGRGVGLDVVRTALSEIRGSVSIDSVINKGSTFTLRLPFALSICKAICCISDNSRIAFPMDGVEDIKEYNTKDIVINQTGQKCVLWQGSLLPFQPLKSLLSFNRFSRRNNVYGGKVDDETFSLIVLRTAGNILAVQVDKVLQQQEIVIKQIEGPIPKPIGIAGATVLGDGSIMPIGDVLELIEIAQGLTLVENRRNHWKTTITNQPFITQTKEKTEEKVVLIVDDSITVREMLSSSFIEANYRVEQARDGQEALDKLRSGLVCDLIFCDIEMPRMNGLDLLANIQKDEKFSNIPVALLTSRAAEKHRSVAAKYGASGYFVKPYTEKDILDAADRIIHGEVLLPGSSRMSRTNQGSEQIDIQDPGENIHSTKTGNCILVVDDSAMIRAMLSASLAKGGYQSVEARDGQDAWEKLRSGLACDLILCDIEMPRMNGLELLSQLQKDPELSTIPIAMITSRGAQKMKTLAAERGAKGYFVKPYIEEELLDATKRLISGEVLLDKTSVYD